MVIVKRPLSHYDVFGNREDGADVIKSAVISGQVLQGASENSMTGLLFQLSSLALIATELFDSILHTSKGTFERISSLTSRVQSMNTKLTDIEQYMIDNNHKLLFTCMGYNFTEKQREILQKVDQQNISPANNPTALDWQYQSNCDLPPAFPEDLDQVMVEDKKKPCIKFYSNPQFFFEHWAKRELARQKNERKMLRRKKKEEKEKRPQKQVATIQLHYKRFDKHGNRIDEPSENPNLDTSVLADESVSSVCTPAYDDEEYEDDGPSTPSRAQSFVASPQPPARGTPPSMANTGPKPPPPPGPPPTSAVPPTMNSPPSRSPSIMSSPSPAMGGPAPPPPPGPPPMMNVPPPPGPPPPMMPSSGGGGGGLNDLIGKGLKKAEVTERPATQMTLLEQIRVGKKLTSASERKVDEKPPAPQATAVSVADILGKKFENVLDDDDSDSDDSEFDDDWD